MLAFLPANFFVSPAFPDTKVLNDGQVFVKSVISPLLPARTPYRGVSWYSTHDTTRKALQHNQYQYNQIDNAKRIDQAADVQRRRKA